MKRNEQHVLETISEKLLESKIPNEWIIRKIEKDYGVDYEIEIVDEEVVSGKRIWLQLKSEKQSSYKKYVNIYTKEEMECLTYQFSADYLKYAQSCPFPLLLFVADLKTNKIYWLPIKDDLSNSIERRNPKWMNQQSIQLRIPIQNDLDKEIKTNYFGLRWYALEIPRILSMSQIIKRLHDASYNLYSSFEFDDNYISNYEEDLMKTHIFAAQKVISEALSMELLYGEKGVDMFLLFKDHHKKAISSIIKIEEFLKTKTFTFLELSIELANISQSLSTLSNLINFYDENRKFICASD